MYPEKGSILSSITKKVPGPNAALARELSGKTVIRGLPGGRVFLTLGFHATFVQIPEKGEETNENKGSDSGESPD